MKFIQIEWTASSLDEAQEIAKELLKKKLVACANILPLVKSLFFWEGKLETADEVKVLFKTKESHFDPIRVYIEAHASYDVPAILVFPIADGNEAFLNFIDEETIDPNQTEW